MFVLEVSMASSNAEGLNLGYSGILMQFHISCVLTPNPWPRSVTRGLMIILPAALGAIIVMFHMTLFLDV